jgi:hypothetical protein
MYRHEAGLADDVIVMYSAYRHCRLYFNHFKTRLKNFICLLADFSFISPPPNLPGILSFFIDQSVLWYTYGTQ